MASTKNAPQTALESGHDQAILFAHYREVVRPKDAEKRGLDLGAGVFAVIHSDGQYAPELVLDLMKPIIEGKAQIVQGSRRNDRCCTPAWHGMRADPHSDPL